MSAVDRLQVQVIRPGQTYVGKQGFTYGAGASADTVGDRHICMNVMPTVCYMLEGECVVRLGDRIQHGVLVRQGDHAFVPADLPHAPYNESGAPYTWLVVHSSGSDQDGIVMLPDLDTIVAAM